MLLEGNSVIGDAAPRESVAPAHVLYIFGPLPANPLAPSEVLASSPYPLQPRQGTLHLRQYDG